MRCGVRILSKFVSYLGKPTLYRRLPFRKTGNVVSLYKMRVDPGQELNPEDVDAHKQHIENTKKYLDSKGIKYTTTENYVEETNYAGKVPVTNQVYIGTTFTIQKP